MNDAHGYSSENILAQLPRVLAEDRRMHALATAITEALAARLGEIDLEEIYIRIDELPETLLDILAVDFAVDWWDGNWPIERKRQSLKDSWRIHRILGTPAAVNLAVQAAFGEGRAEEWFAYGGKPNHIRIVDLSTEAALNGLDSFVRLLSIVARESSALDSITLGVNQDFRLYAGFAERLAKSIQITCREPNFAYLTDENSRILTEENDYRLLDEE